MHTCHSQLIFHEIPKAFKFSNTPRLEFIIFIDHSLPFKLYFLQSPLTSRQTASSSHFEETRNSRPFIGNAATTTHFRHRCPRRFSIFDRCPITDKVIPGHWSWFPVLPLRIDLSWPPNFFVPRTCISAIRIAAGTKLADWADYLAGKKGRKNIGERHGVKGMPIRLVQGRLLCFTEIDSWEWKRRMSSYELRVFDLKLLFLGWEDDSLGTLFEKNHRWFIDCKPLKYFVIKSYIPFISYWTLWNL